MSHPVIRPARANEYDEVGRVWMESWVSTGLGEASAVMIDLVNGMRLGAADSRRDGRAVGW